MGALHYLANFCTVPTTRASRKPIQTVETKVRMDCEGCERRVKSAVNSIKGVKSVEISRKHSKVTVIGRVEPNTVLERVKNTGKKRAKFWPYIEHNLVAYPYVSRVYDKRAPSGFVQDVHQSYHSNYNNACQDNISALFIDDNANACAIM